MCYCIRQEPIGVRLIGPEAFDWFWKACAVIIPFVLLILNRIDSRKSNDRKLLIEEIDKKIGVIDGKVVSLTSRSETAHAELNNKIDKANVDCRENVENLATQVRAFQIDVARTYPTKEDFREKADEWREELRSIRQDHHGRK